MPLDIATDHTSAVTRDGLLKLTASEIAYLQSYLARHDRGGYYMALYNMTGNQQAITQAQIATFSEGVGGTAIFANYLLQNVINITPAVYPGVYYLSQEVAKESLVEVRNRLDENNSLGTNHNTGYIDVDEMFRSAERAWTNNGLGLQFPGNLLSTVAQGGDFVAEKLAWFSQMERVTPRLPN